MMSFKIAFLNIKRSLRDYAIYFFTLILGIAIFYAFNSIETQSAFLGISSTTKEVLRLIVEILSIVSIFVAIILGLLIVYANQFLMKRRNREFAIYMTLGMDKWQISKLLVTETVFIGIISLGAGLLIGLGLSQLMSAFTASLFQADMTKYHFIISGKAIIKTIIYFGIIYVAVVILNGFIISNVTLIKLLHSDKKGEKQTPKNPAVSAVIFIIGAAVLAFAYYRMTGDATKLTFADIVGAIIMGSVSTLMIFYSISGFLLRILLLLKNRFYRNINAFTFRQISSRINTMVVSMTLICLMLFVTICTLSASFAIRDTINRDFDRYCRADMQVIYRSSDGVNKKIEDIYAEKDADLQNLLSDKTDFYIYEDEGVTYSCLLNGVVEATNMNNNAPLWMMKESDYCRLMALYGLPVTRVSEGKYLIIANLVTDYFNQAMENRNEINVDGQTLLPQQTTCIDTPIQLATQADEGGTLVVKDKVLDKARKVAEVFTGNYKADNSTDRHNIENKLRAAQEKIKADNANDNYRGLMLNTRIDIGEASIGISALFTFLGLYIGIVFLLACGALLALKGLSDNVDSIPRYQILRKIGVEERDINRSLFIQTGTFFLLPLLLALVHSIFGIRFAENFTQFAGIRNLTSSYGITAIMVLVIYGGYFAITYFTGKEVIK